MDYYYNRLTSKVAPGFSSRRLCHFSIRQAIYRRFRCRGSVSEEKYHKIRKICILTTKKAFMGFDADQNLQYRGLTILQISDVLSPINRWLHAFTRQPGKCTSLLGLKLNAPYVHNLFKEPDSYLKNDIKIYLRNLSPMPEWLKPAMKNLRDYLDQDFFIVHGPPGTGKTFFSSKLISLLAHDWKAVTKSKPFVCLCTSWTNAAVTVMENTLINELAQLPCNIILLHDKQDLFITFCFLYYYKLHFRVRH